MGKKKKKNESLPRLIIESLIALGTLLTGIASGKNIYSTILLILASVYLLIDIIPRLWKEWKKCQKEIQHHKR